MEDGKPSASSSLSSDDNLLVKNKRNRPNEDEVDDTDEWKQEDHEEEDDVHTEKELLEAKRMRRQKRGDGVDGGTTHIDSTTSLEADGIKIEPFHMDEERSDGTGYFDGDTYVFRKQNADEEPDAWLDTLDGDNENGNKSESKPFAVPRKKENPKNDEDSMDDWTKEQLYSKILPLVSDTETIMQAVRRYGQLLKRKGSKKGESIDQPSHDLAKQCLDDLTGAANALLFKGDVDIYDTTRNRILKLLPEHAEEKEPQAKQASCQWEYTGNQDGQMHGPYTTDNMIAWTQAGYFVGAQQVQIRTIREEELSTKDDLLADLMDDDDEDDDGDGKPKEKKLVKGEWMSSDEVDFKAYL
jgi:CD2 antigen cytoplasmic tail-binding protein 2